MHCVSVCMRAPAGTPDFDSIDIDLEGFESKTITDRIQFTNVLKEETSEPSMADLATTREIVDKKS